MSLLLAGSKSNKQEDKWRAREGGGRGQGWGWEGSGGGGGRGRWRKREQRGGRVGLPPLARFNQVTDVPAENKVRGSNMQTREKKRLRGSCELAVALQKLLLVLFSPICVRLSWQIPLCSVSAAARLCSRFISPRLTRLTLSSLHLQSYFSN